MANGQDLIRGGANMPPVPVAAVAASTNEIDVFAVGADRTPWWWHWNGSIWIPPVPLPNGDLPAERIAAVSPAPGRLDVFAVGRNTQVLCTETSTLGTIRTPLESIPVGQEPL